MSLKTEEKKAEKATKLSNTNLQMQEIAKCVGEVCAEDKIAPPIWREVLDDIESDYRFFHDPSTAPEGCEDWTKQKSIQLLYGDTVKIDAAFRKRAKRHIRKMIQFPEALPHIAAYLARKNKSAV
jgi:hypothetical protein